MSPDEVLRWPEAGQFWAMQNPLSLCRVDDPGNNDGYRVVALHQWTPEGETDQLIFVNPNPEQFSYLWFNRTFHAVGGEFNAPQVGDVWLVHPVKSKSRLLFIGPHTTTEELHILANWDVPSSGLLLTAHLFQPGPYRRSVAPKSVYEHLRKPSV